ncbi:MAG TPA: aminotransferase class I/II-fold pyridoxal phosphate-dependent enzyme [Thermomicrobiales bacterium]|nr:aminotransferase class I/II-fold pyridoxal phosphate-dependent enzyme [Thermomicrobiales bacterium]
MPAFEPSDNLKRMAAASERPVIGPAPQGMIGLGSGDPDFRTPEHIRQAMIDAVNEGYSNYPPGMGDPELLEAIAAKMERLSGQPWSPDELVITSGGSGALFASIAAWINPGDTVLIPEPTFSQYADVTRFVGGEPIFVTQREDFHLDLDALRAAAEQHKPKMVVICSPNNPTGVIYSRAELEGLAQVAADYNMLVLADEAYDHLIHDGHEFVSAIDIPELADRLLYANTFSKTYAMTGWRLGWVAAKDGMINYVGRVSRSAGGGVNWALQRAGIAAITGPMEPTEVMRAEYAARRELIDEMLAGVEGVSWNAPQGAFYAYIKYDAPQIKSRDMAAIMRERGVALRSGTEYGPSGEGYIRVAFATDRKSLTEGMLRVRETLTEAVEGRLKAGAA